MAQEMSQGLGSEKVDVLINPGMGTEPYLQLSLMA
jgi:hypothetical protein